MTTHTPGPFRKSGTRIVCERSAVVVAETSSPGGLNAEERREANGHLFAASPDLLAACERVLSAIDAGRGYDGDVNLTPDDEQLVRAAVAKARKGE